LIDKNQTMVEAELLHNTTVRVIVVGIGNGVDVSELNEIGSGPDTVFQVPDFNTLVTIENQIRDLACIKRKY